jgi:hypothetical protein
MKKKTKNSIWYFLFHNDGQLLVDLENFDLSGSFWCDGNLAAPESQNF